MGGKWATRETGYYRSDTSRMGLGLLKVFFLRPPRHFLNRGHARSGHTGGRGAILASELKVYGGEGSEWGGWESQ